jgi:C1A family cysteine protease
MTFFDVIIDNTINNDYLLNKSSFDIQLIDDIFKFDLKNKMSPLNHFELLGSTANALATLIEYDIPNYRCSRMFIYYNERINTTTYNLNNSIKSLIENGFCEYNDYSYNPKLLNEKPTEDVYNKASENKYKFDIIKIKKDLQSLLLAIINNEPFIVSINVFESFETTLINKEVEIKIPKEKEKQIGGISIVVCGFDIHKQIFIIRYLDRYLELPFFYLLKDNYSSDCFIFILRKFININLNSTSIINNEPIIETNKKIVDLRDKMPMIYDQGKIGSCTANALCSIFEYDNRNFTGSRLFLYYNERALINETNEDNGAYISDGIKSLEKDGICEEKEWAYVSENVLIKPSERAYINAKNNFVIEALNINNDLKTIKEWLDKNEPITIGISIYSNFMNNKSGVISLPTENDKFLGGHAVVICGYNDYQEIFILRNSWGNYWGDKGYFYLPYSYITNNNLCGDLWIITKSKIN